MPRVTDSLQRPTTLLTVKRTKATAIDYDTFNAERAELILMTDDNGKLLGDIRVATKTGGTTVPLYPVGSIIYYAGLNQPAGWLFCNGSTYDKDLYRELYSYLGPEYDVEGDPTLFRVPDYANTKRDRSVNQGGLFIRNLNPGFPTGNTALPDYYHNRWNDFNQKGDYNVSTVQTNRQFGSIQDELYPYHDHPILEGNTSFTGEEHSHKYFGAEGASNGIDIGNTNKYAMELTRKVVRSGIGTTDSGGYPSARVPIPDSPLAPTGQEYEVGAHVHTGWIGHGTSINTDVHNTVHGVANTGPLTVDNKRMNFNNIGETQPKNYSVFFLIKY